MSFIRSIWATHSSWFCGSSLAFNFLKIIFTSPMMLASVSIFLLISAGSMSIWRILAFFANLLAFPTTRSLNLAPITTNRSHSVMPKLDVLVPCMPTIPVYNSWVPSNAPLPIRVSATGAWSLFANVRTSSAASERIAPPPTMINGFWDFLIIKSARSKSSSVIVSTWRAMVTGSFASYSQLAAVTSLVISTSTGPGRPLLAIWKALLRTSANFVMSFTMKLYFVIGIVTPVISISWKLSRPKRLTPTLQVMATTGMESM